MSCPAKFKEVFKIVEEEGKGKGKGKGERERQRDKGFRGLIEGAVSRLNLALSPGSVFIVVIFPLFSLPLCSTAFGFCTRSKGVVFLPTVLFTSRIL